MEENGRGILINADRQIHYTAYNRLEFAGFSLT
jgi:hypothetical protein